MTSPAGAPTDADLEQGTIRRSIRGTFRPDTTRGRAAVASGLLFLAGPILGVFVSRWFFLLLIPAVLLSVVGLASDRARSGTAGRLGATGLVMTFNGVALMIALFVVGFISDFLVSGQDEHETSSVALGYTTVHVMLGIGLMLYDNYRHARSD